MTQVNKMANHELIFSMTLKTSSTLLYGNLALVYPDGTTINYLATSGCADWQRPGDEWVRGKGIIPAGEYQVATVPYHLDTRGVEGDFYHITPDPVVSEQGQVRAELGVHFDANVPGTAGCIALINYDGWQGYCRRMKSISGSHDSLPLKVFYSDSL